MLDKLNENPKWRSIFGKVQPDRRQRDAELILRFFALHYESAKYEKPMKKWLTKFMAANRKPSEDKLAEYRSLFEETVAQVHATLGDKPFHIHAGLNAAVFDATFAAFAKHKGKATAKTKGLYAALLKNESFIECITAATTDEDVVKERLRIANEKLFPPAK